MLAVGGIALGFVFIGVHKRLGDPFLEVLTTLAVPYVAYILAEFAEKVTRTSSKAGQTIGSANLAKRLRHAAIKAERVALIRVWHEQRIGDELLHQFEEILDYQEAQS